MRSPGDPEHSCQSPDSIKVRAHAGRIRVQGSRISRDHALERKPDTLRGVATCAIKITMHVCVLAIVLLPAWAK